MIELRIKGGEKLRSTAKLLKGKANKDLRNELQRELRRSAKEFGKVVPAEVHHFMPSGYAPTLRQNLRVVGKVNVSALRAGVSLQATSKASKHSKERKSEIAKLEKGMLRHPVYGNRSVWVNQTVKPGFFSKPIIKNADIFYADLVRAVENVAAKIARS